MTSTRCQVAYPRCCEADIRSSPIRYFLWLLRDVTSATLRNGGTIRNQPVRAPPPGTDYPVRHSSHERTMRGDHTYSHVQPPRS